MVHEKQGYRAPLLHRFVLTWPNAYEWGVPWDKLWLMSWLNFNTMSSTHATMLIVFKTSHQSVTEINRMLLAPARPINTSFTFELQNTFSQFLRSVSIPLTNESKEIINSNPVHDVISGVAALGAVQFSWVEEGLVLASFFFFQTSICLFVLINRKHHRQCDL